jgi:hypothetical protein
MSDARHQSNRPEISEPVEWSEARSMPRSPISKRPTAGAILDEIDPLIGVIPVAGPPVVLVTGAWLVLALMLAGPFALLVTFGVVVVAAAALIGLIGAILAAPYLLVHHVRAYLARHSKSRALAEPLPANPPAVADRALLPEPVSAPGY